MHATTHGRCIVFVMQLLIVSTGPHYHHLTFYTHTLARTHKHTHTHTLTPYHIFIFAHLYILTLAYLRVPTLWCESFTRRSWVAARRRQPFSRRRTALSMPTQGRIMPSGRCSVERRQSRVSRSIQALQKSCCMPIFFAILFHIMSSTYIIVVLWFCTKMCWAVSFCCAE